MRNRDLAADHLRRAGARLRAIDVLYDSGSWADVVRESQEVVELTLKGLLRACGVDPPRIHDVADVLVAERSRLPGDLDPHVERLAKISRALRRDRELAFYGAEDLTPSSFYREGDAVLARDSARDVVATVRPHVADTL
jgi:HEPN domain-containing protein